MRQGHHGSSGVAEDASAEAKHPSNLDAVIDQRAEAIGRSLAALTPSLQPLARPLALAASHEVTVLLTGETGTGKTYLARILHQHSPQQDHGFLAVSCGALASSLVESELFGHIQGAFTGADRPKRGRFAAAGHGTLLLDEIDALGLDQQAKLLRVMETGEYEPVGSNDTHRCKARIIAASNWNLEEAIQKGKFRQDLYYRLAVITFHLPPLRERVEDIALLVLNLLTRFSNQFGKDVCHVRTDALGLLEQYSWPGNIRQLENVVQAAVLCCTGEELLPGHLPIPVWVGNAGAPLGEALAGIDPGTKKLHGHPRKGK